MTEFAVDVHITHITRITVEAESQEEALERVEGFSASEIEDAVMCASTQHDGYLVSAESLRFERLDEAVDIEELQSA